MMGRIVFVLLLVVRASVSIWPFPETNELCTRVYNCSCSKERKTVDCSSLAITELTSELTFSSAEGVFFRNNEIKVIDRNFAKGDSVKEIDFSHNAIGVVADNAFALLPGLVGLDLSHNRIWNLGVEVFNGPTSLQVLDLSYNNLQGFFSIIFAKTPQLRKLLLTYNPLISLDDRRFEYLTNLEYLDLQFTGLISLNNDLFVDTPSLKYLSLAGNALEEVPSLRTCRKLLTLELSDNPITEIRGRALEGLGNLNSLYLNRMKDLEAIGAYAFHGLYNLRTLYCSFNYRLAKIDPLAFTSNYSLPVKNIEVVYLRDNALTTISKRLFYWDNLYHTDLRGNPWNCDCNLEWMKEMKWKHDLQYNIRCAAPPKFAGRLVGALKSEDFTCQHHMSAELIITLTLITTASFSAILAVIGLFVSRKGWCISCRSRIQMKYYQVSKTKEAEIDYEPKE